MATCCEESKNKCNLIVNIEYLKDFVDGTGIEVTTPQGKNDGYCPTYEELISGRIAPITDDSITDYFYARDGIYVNPTPYTAPSASSGCCPSSNENKTVRVEDLSLSYYNLIDFNASITSATSLCNATSWWEGGYKVVKNKKSIDHNGCSETTSTDSMEYEVPDNRETHGANICESLAQGEPGDEVFCHTDSIKYDTALEVYYPNKGETYSSEGSYTQEGMDLNIEWFNGLAEEIIETDGTSGNIVIGSVSSSENVTIGEPTVTASFSPQSVEASVEDGQIILNVGQYINTEDRNITVSLPYTVCNTNYAANSLSFTQSGRPFVPSSASPDCCEYSTSSLTSCDSQMYFCRYNNGTSNQMSNWAYIDGMRLKVADNGYFNEQIVYDGHNHKTGATGSSEEVDATQERLTQHMNKHAVVDVPTTEANAVFHVYNERVETNEGMFNGVSDLVEVTLPCGVTTIKANSFKGASSLEKYNDINQIVRIEDNAFEDCTSLKVIGGGSNLQYIGNNAFRNCTTPTSVDLNSHITHVGNNAFEGCTNLTTAEINADEIGNEVFKDCTSLENVSIYSNVTSIGSNVFTGCSSIKTLYYNSPVPVSDGPWGSVEEVKIGSDTTRIEDNAFYEYSTLTSVTMSDGITSIGASAFEGCGISYIGIPDSVTEIGSGAFLYCENLTEVDMPTNITSIAEGTFSQCSGLTDITIPDGVEVIGEHAFADCVSLTGIDIPDSVTEIGRRAFAGCGLISVTIGDGITSINQEAFNCETLTDVYVHAVTPPYLSGSAIPPNIKIHVPSESITEYEKSTEWGGHGYIFEPL